MTAAIPAARPTGRPCSGCWPTCRAGKVDVIVVYKVDRLTRSLADFAKLVELFDGHGVSFVSVTQQFNTTTSMGRLTLNVLLSFAQFEREVTSERIRDKIAASKRKGLWVGGMAPLGYETKDRKIVVDEEEAERVRTIFRRYLGAWQPQPADGRPSRARDRHQGRRLSRRARPSAGSRSPAAPSPIFCAIGSTSARSSSRARSCPASSPPSSIENSSTRSKPSSTSNAPITRPRGQIRVPADRSHLRRPRQPDDAEPCPQGRDQISLLPLVSPPPGTA